MPIPLIGTLVSDEFTNAKPPKAGLVMICTREVRVAYTLMPSQHAQNSNSWPRCVCTPPSVYKQR
ncbi:hypothetical protein M404DRAFT_598759 [Pisolithus tinctorius Marx 270]|uniref:Uncharacterized protein n=1 Tax=Pisolithus tinctorius Marx 270 TaxID=870435 RepID=A0A0C3N0E5_PISTI|nr:hypothetical protein M404DRAFT_374589 [Pisolithus tinctorius Marx 270]KIO04024.1 hypothetical protein M404DRAFT_598759 [Pisolithus tinctorius Marx 270]